MCFQITKHGLYLKTIDSTINHQNNSHIKFQWVNVGIVDDDFDENYKEQLNQYYNKYSARSNGLKDIKI